ncbi:hypothetical protein NZK35_23355 [Stieleria sp. ICT_E10.1]|nr:hypothetical protein [Stieleria sedimenti]MCS7469599.1 hypothetical protein [Stieleria sedimenti]
MIRDSLLKGKAVFDGGLDDATLQILSSQFDRGFAAVFHDFRTVFGEECA